MAKLTAAARKKIPTKSFAGPDRSYAINDRSHAANALSRVSQHGSPELKARVRAKVHAKYPDMGRAHGGGVDDDRDDGDRSCGEPRAMGGVVTGRKPARRLDR